MKYLNLTFVGTFPRWRLMVRLQTSSALHSFTSVFKQSVIFEH